jgi:hypothetical protein
MRVSQGGRSDCSSELSAGSCRASPSIEEVALKAVALWTLAALLGWAAEGAADQSVEINGVTIFRGMPEAEVRAAFAYVHCVDEAPGIDSGLVFCGLDDGVRPGVDGEVTFRDGQVYRATRNWFVGPDANAFDGLLAFDEVLESLIGEAGACMRVEMHPESLPRQTLYLLPDRVVTVMFHTSRPPPSVVIKESLRVNPQRTACADAGESRLPD